MFLRREMRDDHVALLTLDDEKRRNALSAELVGEIVAAFDALEADDEVHAVVITGSGTVFCAGGDTSALARYASGDSSSEERGDIAQVYEGFLRVHRSTLPTIAAVNGPAVGAGLNLALACDVRMASASARFDARFLRIGLHPGGGHLWLLERAVGPQTALAMTLFGAVLSSDEAATRGLAWSVHPDAELVDAAVALAGRAGKVPKSLAARAKDTLRLAPWQPDFDAAVRSELVHQTWSFGQGWFGQK
ncbi:MAG TPA: enoyl-CoA hydratase-related protein [Acidimicrobiia bacterium]